MKLWKIMLIVSGITAIILAFFMIVPVIVMDKSWRWFFGPLIFFGIAYIIAGLVILIIKIITNIAKEIGVHVNSVKDMIDMYETIKDAAKIDIIRDKKDNIRRIVRVKEDSTQIAFKKEIRDAVVNINNRMDQVAEDTKEIKNKVEKNPK